VPSDPDVGVGDEQANLLAGMAPAQVDQPPPAWLRDLVRGLEPSIDGHLTEIHPETDDADGDGAHGADGCLAHVGERPSFWPPP
jgi:hypothetical protein